MPNPYGRAWRDIRGPYLEQHPWCAWPGCGARATDADHRTPRKVLIHRGVENPDAERYLQPLCAKHHRMKTISEAGWRGARWT